MVQCQLPSRPWGWTESPWRVPSKLFPAHLATHLTQMVSQGKLVVDFWLGLSDSPIHSLYGGPVTRKEWLENSASCSSLSLKSLFQTHSHRGKSLPVWGQAQSKGKKSVYLSLDPNENFVRPSFTVSFFSFYLPRTLRSVWTMRFSNFKFLCY